MNVFVGIGRITKDIELRYTQSNKAYTKFTLAINRAIKSQDGKDADFLNVTTWGNQAENMAKFLKKGSLIAVRARIETGTYQAQDGTTRYTTDVIADSVQFLEPRSGDNQQSQQSGGHNSFDPNFSNSNFNSAAYAKDDDLPF